MIQVTRGLHRLAGSPDFTRLHRGQPPEGPQDRYSCWLGNRLVGNEAGTDAIEFSLLAPIQFKLSQNSTFLVAGAPCSVVIGDETYPDWTLVSARSGETIRLRPGKSGCRVYVCVPGGLHFQGGTYSCADLPPRITPADLLQEATQRSQRWLPPLGTLRIVRGLDYSAAEFDQAIVEGLQATNTVMMHSSDMGVRLSGSTVDLPAFDIVSSPVVDGTIQATDSGLIALLRQRGTLGGYPRIATVIDIDVDRLAQFRPGNQLRFHWVEPAEAERLMRLQQETMQL